MRYTAKTLASFPSITYLFKSPIFILSLSLGPFCWLVLYVLFAPPLDLLWPLSSPWLFVVPVFFYPVVEELAFRGWLQGLLLEKKIGQYRLGSLTIANVCTSFLFAALHVVSYTDYWMGLVFFPSLIFGLLREQYRRVLPSIVVHSFYNFGFMLIFPKGLSI